VLDGKTDGGLTIAQFPWDVCLRGKLAQKENQFQTVRMKSSTTMRRLLSLLAAVAIASLPLSLSADTFHITEIDEVLTTDIPGAIISVVGPDSWQIQLPGTMVLPGFDSRLTEPENPSLANIVNGSGDLILWSSDTFSGVPSVPSPVTIPGAIVGFVGAEFHHDLVLADIKTSSSVPDTASSILLLGLSVLGLCGFRTLHESKI
jgi:hypothetical protein